MINPFANTDHPVMTGFAGAENLGVVHRCYRHPGTADMATFTVISRVDMSGILAGRIAALMAAHAGLPNYQ